MKYVLRNRPWNTNHKQNMTTDWPNYAPDVSSASRSEIAKNILVLSNYAQKRASTIGKSPPSMQLISKVSFTFTQRASGAYRLIVYTNTALFIMILKKLIWERIIFCRIIRIDLKANCHSLIFFYLPFSILSGVLRQNRKRRGKL